MNRITFRIPKENLEEIEQRVEEGEFPSRSEAIRTAVRELLHEDYPTGSQTPSVDNPGSNPVVHTER